MQCFQSSFDFQNVARMESIFLNCTSLTSVDLSNFNTVKLYYIEDMFNGCSSLTSLDFSKFIADKIIFLNRLFYRCSNLKYIDFSPFNVTSNGILLFDNTIPKNGKIIINNKEVYSKINKTIPSSWEIVYKY